MTLPATIFPGSGPDAGDGEEDFVAWTKLVQILDYLESRANTADATSALALAGKAPLNSPAFTGTPTAPTASPDTNTTQVASTAFVRAAITALVNSSPAALDTLKELADAIGDDPNFAVTVTNSLAVKAPLDSPAFLNNPTAPTQPAGNNSTRLATTAYVDRVVALPRAYLTGLGLSNDATTPATVLDIAAGKARDSTDAADLVLASPFTKTVSSAWAAGSGNGALDTGTIATGWYHVFLIGRTDGTARDILVSLSATAPTMPPGYTYRRRIGSFQWASNAIRPFTQLGDEFLLTMAAADVNAIVGTSSSLFTLSVPSGIKTRAIIEGNFNNTAGNVAVVVTSPDTTDVAPVVPTLGISGGNFSSGVNAYGNFALLVRTSLGAQIRARSTAASTGFYVTTKGWLDRRGQDD